MPRHAHAPYPSGAFKEDTEQNRRIMYRFYRYINVAHLHTYRRINDMFRAVTLDDIKDAGLLTSDEDRKLRALGCSGTETVSAWIAMLYQQCVHEQRFPPNFSNVSLGTVRHGQDLMQEIALFNEKRMPDWSLALMTLVLDTFHLLIVIVMPVTLNLRDYCVQPLTILGVFLISLCYSSLLRLVTAIRDPFSGFAEIVNVDLLLCDTDCWIFRTLRTSFEKDVRADLSPRLSRTPHPSIERGPRAF